MVAVDAHIIELQKLFLEELGLEIPLEECALYAEQLFNLLRATYKD